MLTFTFDQRLVDLIHRKIPNDRRHFDYEQRAWVIYSIADVATIYWLAGDYAEFRWAGHQRGTA